MGNVPLVQGFVYRLVGPRPDFAFTMTDGERATMAAHAGYWSELAEQGVALAVGPVDDPAGSYGIAIILAEDMAAAEALREADPAYSSPHDLRIEIAPMLNLLTPGASYRAR